MPPLPRLRLRSDAPWLAGLGLLLVLALPACSHTRQVTHTPRTATEQLLVAEAMERAVDDLALPGVEGRRVALELVGVARGAEFHDDLPYLHAALVQRLRRDGARLVEAPEAERIVAVRVGTLGTTATQSSFGLPAVPLVVAETPEIKFYRSLSLHGFAKLRVAQRSADGTPHGEEEVLQRTRFKVRKILFLTFRSERDVYPKGRGPD